MGILLAAESSATIASALDAKGSLTLFAPTNDAIGGLSEVPPPAALDDILTYHVHADGAVNAATALTFENMSIEMLNGDSATVDGGDMVTVTDTGATTSTVTTADILADNGVIHVIDGVLLPNSVTNPSEQWIRKRAHASVDRGVSHVPSLPSTSLPASRSTLAWLTHGSSSRLVLSLGSPRCRHLDLPVASPKSGS